MLTLFPRARDWWQKSAGDFSKMFTRQRNFKTEHNQKKKNIAVAQVLYGRPGIEPKSFDVESE